METKNIGKTDSNFQISECWSYNLWDCERPPLFYLQQKEIWYQISEEWDRMSFYSLWFWFATQWSWSRTGERPSLCMVATWASNPVCPPWPFHEVNLGIFSHRYGQICTILAIWPWLGYPYHGRPCGSCQTWSGGNIGLLNLLRHQGFYCAILWYYPCSSHWISTKI